MGSERKEKKKSRKRSSSPSSSEDEGGRRKRQRSDEEEGDGRRSRKSDKKEKRKDKKSHRHNSDKEKKSKDKHKTKQHKGDRHLVDLFERDEGFVKAGNKPELQLSNEDYFSKNNEFATWLKEKKKIFFSDLSSESARELFSVFVKDWNAQKLESRYYEGISSGPRSAHNWALKL